MELHARAFYTAQVLGVFDTMHPALFQAMNVDHKRLANEDEIQALFVANGVAAEDFSKAFNSFGVSSQVKQAAARAKAAKITGTPALMVDGKYHVSTRKAGSQADMLKVSDFLIEKERAARGN
jgi:thiol:disulfide interchange protein DsbA